MYLVNDIIMHMCTDLINMILLPHFIIIIIIIKSYLIGERFSSIICESDY